MIARSIYYPRHFANPVMANLPAFPADHPSGRTLETEALYRRRAALFELRAAEELGLGEEPPGAMQVAAYASELRAEWSKSTWRQMKASLIFYFEERGNSDGIQAASLLRATSQSDSIQKSERTSGRRAKSVRRSSFDQVLEAVRGCRSQFAGMLESWLLLGSQIGLRPHEWKSCALVEATPFEMGDVDHTASGADPHSPAPYLRVRNGKNTNGRSHGEYRHLNLSRLPEGTLRAVAEFAGLMSEVEQAGLYQKYYGGCQRLLHRINLSLHGPVKPATRSKSGKKVSSPRWVQLYSGRHMFSSEAKRELPKVGVAAAMGHSTTKTASEHYGRRNAQTRVSGGLGPRPIASEVIRVRVKNSTRPVSAPGNSGPRKKR